jgi:phosphoenolpyruvate carboxylase
MQGFIAFFRQATPIDAIEQSRIGSRPSRRSGASSLEDLRAIPWVFSWSQCRYNMTSWYGVGSTLLNLKQGDPQAYAKLKIAIKSDPYIRYVFTNVDTSLASTDIGIMTEYASLVEDESIRSRFLGLFIEELQKTQEAVRELLGRTIEVRRKNHHYSSMLRASLMDPLHRTQVNLLRDWRKQKAKQDSDEPGIPLRLLTTINAIASAMRNTG